MQTFRIAEVFEMGDTNVIDKKKKVTEDTFWSFLEFKLKELTKEKPEKYDDLLPKVKGHLNLNTPVTIAGSQFSITGRK